MRIKPVFWVMGIILLLILLAGVIFFNMIFPSPISKAKMERLFKADQDLLVPIADYFIDLEYSSIYITNNHESGFMHIRTEQVQIENPEIVRCLDTLFNERGYSVIGKKDSTIYFQRWSSLERGRGIAYTVNSLAPKIEYVTDYSKLSKDNWYYYEEDFNEYKRRDQGN